MVGNGLVRSGRAGEAGMGLARQGAARSGRRGSVRRVQDGNGKAGRAYCLPFFFSSVALAAMRASVQRVLESLGFEWSGHRTLAARRKSA